MNTSTTNQLDLSKVIKTFLQELPVAESSASSSITKSYLLNGIEVKLRAGKNRGMQGCIWNVDILEINCA